jgi:hypothetical protein
MRMPELLFVGRILESSADQPVRRDPRAGDGFPLPARFHVPLPLVPEDRD